MKLELRGSSVSRPGSETGSERGVGGVPLAGPVHLPIAMNGGDHVYRYSTEYPEPSFPPKAKVGTLSVYSAMLSWRWPRVASDVALPRLAGRPEQQRLRALRGLLARLHPAALAEPAAARLGRAPGAAAAVVAVHVAVQPAGVRGPALLGGVRQPVPAELERLAAAAAHKPRAQREPQHGQHGPHRWHAPHGAPHGPSPRGGAPRPQRAAAAATLQQRGAGPQRQRRGPAGGQAAQLAHVAVHCAQLADGDHQAGHVGDARIAGGPSRSARSEQRL